ncbi:MAG: hypothetical protein EOP22_15295 [Hyphomicrobiales bacterium]|nr:MAG: hypothetical protein EOP22_15295 [Hyphomicrobiales bacterium]
MRQAASWIAALLLGVLPIGIAGIASTEVHAAETAIVLSADEQEMLAANPALAELAVDAPELLREVLDRIAEALAHPSKTRGGMGQLDADTIRLFGQNPILLNVWRSSPEASADLLQLIRIAAGGSKPKQ